MPDVKVIWSLAVLFAFTVFSPCVAQEQTDRIPLLKSFRPFGGAGNNLRNAALSAVPGTPELALTPLRFAPHTVNGLIAGPNPRTISNVIAGGTGEHGQDAQTDDPTRSAWLYVFGQFIDHDLDLESTPLTMPAINVVVPAGDPLYKAGAVISMTRSVRDPRTNTLINMVAGYLDLSQLYGQTMAVARTLVNPDGTLKTSGKGSYLPVVNDRFVSGDPRLMENPELTATTILFMREHNFWVRTLKTSHPAWSGSQLFFMAREITTAQYQNIIYTEYLPQLLGPVLRPCGGYDPNVNAQVTQEFASAAFRLHTQVSDSEVGLDDTGKTTFSESLAQAFFNTPEVDEANGFDDLIRSIGADYSQATDVYVVAVLRDLLNAGLVGGGKDLIDLIAIDIQRERDVGLGTLNATRRAIGMAPYSSFSQLTRDLVLQRQFHALYGNIDNVDLFMGGLAEAHSPGAAVGPTFAAIIADEFARVRAGDRFFWQNEGFDAQTSAMIASTTLATLIRRNTTTTNIQSDVFVEAAFPNYVKARVKLRLP
jgi:peroxidase